MFRNATDRLMGRAGFEDILDKHVRTAATACPSLTGRSTSPRQLRHSFALTMLQATADIRKVALWLGWSMPTCAPPRSNCAWTPPKSWRPPKSCFRRNSAAATQAARRDRLARGTGIMDRDPVLGSHPTGTQVM